MRRLWLILAAAACLAVLPMGASAATVVNVNMPLAQEVFNPCNGDVLLFTGTIHLVIGSTSDGAGGFHDHFDVNVHDVTAVSTTGTVYQGVGGDWFEINVRPPFPFVATETGSFGLISHGATQNFFVHVTFHITINANGTMTSNVERVSITCR